MLPRIAILALLLLAAPTAAQETSDLEGDLERALAGASQGDLHPEIALRDADALLASAPGSARYHFARGVALHHMLRFDEATAAFDRAAALGMGDRDEYLAGNPLGDWRKWAAAGKRLVPPVRYVYPDGAARPLIALRYFDPGPISRLAQAMVPELVKLGTEVLGGVPEGTAMILVPSPEAAEELDRQAIIDLRPSGTGLRHDAAAFGCRLGCYFFERFPDQGSPVTTPEPRLRAVIAHELCHGLAMRRRLGKLVSGGVPAWFEEGLAVGFEERATGVTEADALARFLEAARAAGDAPQQFYVLGAFQNVASQVALNYSFASFMVKTLVAEKGPGILARINDALAEPLDSEEVSDFADKLEAVAGTKPDALFERTVAALKVKLGDKYPAPKQVADPWTQTVTGRLGGVPVKKVLLDVAAVEGIYSDFLYAMEAPEAADDYGQLYRGGYTDPKAKGIATEAPAGYWVYAEPYWIVWGTERPDD